MINETASRKNGFGNIFQPFLAFGRNIKEEPITTHVLKTAEPIFVEGPGLSSGKNMTPTNAVTNSGKEEPTASRVAP